MNLSQRATTLGGLAMVVISITTVVSIALMATGSSDKDPFERDDVAEFLTDVNDEKGLLQAAAAVGIFNDAIVVPIVAAALYVLFRDRNPLLATITMVAVAVTAAVALMVDGSNILLTIIAEDFAEGGAGDIAAGDPATLELGRYVAMITFAFVNVLFTTYGVATVALGALLLGPQGRINPPKWMGWLAIVSGLSAWLAWTVVAADPGFVFFPIQLITSFVLFLALGIWLLRHGDLEPAPMNA